MTQGGAYNLYQLNDYYSTQVKSLTKVMTTLNYMLESARLSAKTIWCLKEGLDVHCLKSHSFGQNLASSIAMPYAAPKNINGLTEMF